MQTQRVELVHIAFVDEAEAMKVSGRFVCGFQNGACAFEDSFNLNSMPLSTVDILLWVPAEVYAPQEKEGLLLLNQELSAHVLPGLQADLALNVPLPAAPTAASLPAWPNTLPDQVRAVAQVLTTATAAMPPAALEASFKGKGPWKKGLPRILETLEALGRARREGDGNDWRA